MNSASMKHQTVDAQIANEPARGRERYEVDYRVCCLLYHFHLCQRTVNCHTSFDMFGLQSQVKFANSEPMSQTLQSQNVVVCSDHVLQWALEADTQL